ncbi:MAG: HlyC/CorC family transporter [Candidatus Methanoperedens sp.]|nr:HlyC/CorC family transporter [Candidatus Methanoperedens sp.]
MDFPLAIEIFIISILVVLSAFFSGSETALISINKIRIRHLADTGNKNATVILELLENPEQFLTAILIGNNIVNISASVLAADAALHTFGNSGIAIATAVMTMFILVFGEVFPKTLASRHPESIALHVAKPIRTVIFILSPLVWVLTESINFLIVRFGGKERVQHPFVTEEKIKMMLRVGEKEGTIEKHEREIIHNVFELSDTKATGVMTPLEKIVCIEESNTLDTALALINESGHSRIPVYKETLDNITGMVYAKDFLKFNDHELSWIKIRQVLRPTLVVRGGRKIYPIMKELQQKKMNISVVVDDNGRVIGLVSIEDILEELVGEIFDEYDVETGKGL